MTSRILHLFIRNKFLIATILGQVGNKHILGLRGKVKWLNPHGGENNRHNNIGIIRNGNFRTLTYELRITMSETIQGNTYIPSP